MFTKKILRMSNPGESDLTSDFLRREKEALKDNCSEILEQLENETLTKKDYTVENAKDDQLFDGAETTTNDTLTSSNTQHKDQTSQDQAGELNPNFLISTDIKKEDVSYSGSYPVLNGNSSLKSATSSNPVKIEPSSNFASAPESNSSVNNETINLKEYGGLSNLFIGSSTLENRSIYLQSEHTMSWLAETKKQIEARISENQRVKEEYINKTNDRIIDIMNEYHKKLELAASNNTQKTDTNKDSSRGEPPDENLWEWVNSQINDIASNPSINGVKSPLLSSSPTNINIPRLSSSFTDKCQNDDLTSYGNTLNDSRRMEWILSQVCNK